jgi:hypothetical protein
MNPANKNPLTAWFDADPAGWKPYIYAGHVDLGIAADSQGTITLATMFAPFMWDALTHGIVGNILDPETSGLYNDGQYLISVKDERTNYTHSPVPANLGFGPHHEGPYPPLPFPIFFPANHSVTVELTNIYARVLTPESETFRVYIALKGLHYWGSLRPPQELLDMSRGQ